MHSQSASENSALYCPEILPMIFVNCFSFSLPVGDQKKTINQKGLKIISILESIWSIKSRSFLVFGLREVEGNSTPRKYFPDLVGYLK